MNLDFIRDYCLKKKGVTEEFPFDSSTLVFKVMNKCFLLTGISPPLSVNLKCDPETAIELRERYSAVTPGYHMNKKHWNTVEINGSIPPKLILKWIDDSYELVVNGLKKSDKLKLEKL
ncbi:MAG: MmcQ/YjbR family DNA-binding protein [Ignavibacteria bacterium]